MFLGRKVPDCAVSRENTLSPDTDLGGAYASIRDVRIPVTR
jgi:hypothetical protein